MDWIRGRTIGRGSSATVSIATAHESGKVLAVKSVCLSQSKPLKREQSILSSLMDCPQIIGYKGYEITLENGQLLYNLFLEYVSGGTLSEAVRKRDGPLDEPTIRSYTRQIVKGLVHLHSNGIIHCDIKPQNILVSKDGVKIADFGCSTWVEKENAFGSPVVPFLCGADLQIPSHLENEPKPPHQPRNRDTKRSLIIGTPIYGAPEVARGEQQGYPADIWALGCTVIEMATGKPPWPDVSDPVSALYKIGFSRDAPEIPGLFGEKGRDFLNKCLKIDPQERSSASELLEHEFLAENEEPTMSLKQNCNFDNWDSPTSVLDQGCFWESVETVQNLAQKFSSKSPIERLWQLGQGDTTELPNWEWDEVWITVRSSCRTEDFGLMSDYELTSTTGRETDLVGQKIIERQSLKRLLCKGSMFHVEEGLNLGIEKTYCSNHSHFFCTVIDERSGKKQKI